MTIRSTRDVLRSTAHGVVWVASIYGLCLAAALLVSRYRHIPLTDLVRDPAVVLNGRPLTGLVSNLGILAWSAAASVCLFAAAVGWQHPHTAALRRYLGAFGLLTLVLLLDDLFMLHEWASAGLVPQPLIPGSYGALALLLLIRFRDTVRTTDYPLLIAALASFAVSAGLDTVLDRLQSPPPGAMVAEDVIKLLGIVSWAVYFVRTAAASIGEPLRRHTSAVHDD